LNAGFDFSREFESEHDGRNKVVRIHKYEQVKGCKYGNVDLDKAEAAN
jgi:hypothetical protein